MIPCLQVRCSTNWANRADSPANHHNTIRSKNFRPIKWHLQTQPKISIESVGWGKWCTVRFKKNKSNFLWNLVVSGIVCSGCCKRTLFLINGEVAFWEKSFWTRKNNETQDGVEVRALPLFIILQVLILYFKSRVERKTMVTQTYFWNPCLGATWTPL